jgi:hypothetical protein
MMTFIFGTLIAVMFQAVFLISDQGDENAINIGRLFICVNNDIRPCQ